MKDGEIWGEKRGKADAFHPRLNSHGAVSNLGRFFAIRLDRLVPSDIILLGDPYYSLGDRDRGNYEVLHSFYGP